MEKYPYSRVQPTLRRFHSVIDVHLDTLTQHKHNIEKYRACKKWSELHKEQTNASRTVQQIASSLREVEKTKALIIESDLEKFDTAIKPSRQKAQDALMDFLLIEPSAADSHTSNVGSHMPVAADASADYQKIDSKISLSVDKPTKEDTTLLDQLQTQMSSEPVDSACQEQARESWFSLEKNVQDLKDLMSTLSNAVYSQRCKVDRIEDHVEESHTNVQSGVKELSTAAKLKSAMLPVTGAVIGGLVGGPVGLAVGVKIGLAAGVGGGAIGYLGGRFIKNKQNDGNDIAMQNMRNEAEGTK